MASKISNEGKYLPFYGYTIVSMCITNLSHIEEFIKSTLLAKYFAPLPARSYHMTIYNIWCHDCKPLPFHKNWLDDEFNRKASANYQDALEWEKSEIKQIAGPVSKWWGIPEHIINPKMLKCNDLCKEAFNGDLKAEYKVAGTLFAKRIIGITITQAEKLETLSSLRNKFTDIFGHGDENLKYHITLAYMYKDIPESDVDAGKLLLTKLNEMIISIPYLTLRTPIPRWFCDMENYLHWWNLKPVANSYYHDL